MGCSVTEVPFQLGTPRAAPAGFPPDVAPNGIVYAAHINAIRDSVAKWPGDVDGQGHILRNVTLVNVTGGAGAQTPWTQNIDANNKSLSNVGGAITIINAATVASIGITSAAADPGIQINNTAAGGRKWCLLSSGGSSGLGAGVFSIYDLTAGAAVLAVSASAIKSVNRIGIGVDADANSLLHLYRVVSAAAQPAVLFDTGATAKARIGPIAAGVGRIDILANAAFNGSAFNADDTAQSCYALSLTPSAGSSGGIQFRRAVAGGNPRTMITDLMISYQGFVGVGTASPVAQLHTLAGAPVLFGCPITAGAMSSGTMENQSMTWHYNEGAAQLTFRVKDAGGTVRTGVIAVS
jgi:hypothetical protein